MPQYSAAFLTLAMGSVKALFLAPRGRHARRRHRSTRVRRYAPLPQATTPALASSTSAPVPALHRAPAPRLGSTPHPALGLGEPAPRREGVGRPHPASDPIAVPRPRPGDHRGPAALPADAHALVRPYFAAHEQSGASDLHRDRARDRDLVLELDHVLDRVQARATARMAAWAGRDVPFSGDLLAPDPVAPAPRAPRPDCEDPDDWRTFTRLTRVWLDQQEHRRLRPAHTARTTSPARPARDHRSEVAA